MSKRLPEITPKAIFLGILLSMILAAANAYLGLFAGMTVSASIPAAVISMAILKQFKNSNILENNIVQTAASAGESLAAGVIFTLPALVLMGYWGDGFDYLEVAKISAIGGVIGVLFTVPLRRALILKAKLKYPEGVATAAILEAGMKTKSNGSDDDSNNINIIAFSSILGGTLKLLEQGFGMWKATIQGATVLTATRAGNAVGASIFSISTSISPSLISVGYIVGRNIGILVVSGGLFSWLVAIPIYSAIYGFKGEATSAAAEIWNSQIRYLGIGAMVVGGVWSLVELFKPMIQGIKASIDALKISNNTKNVPLEEQDFPINYVGYSLLVLLIPVFLLYLDILNDINISILLTLVMMVFGFLFSSVAAYMAGIVGSSNNPISGVTIATILFSSFLLLLLGKDSIAGASAAIMIGAVVCCAAAIGGDNLQDLKTGHILGATPWKQQVMQIIGTLSSALVLGLVLDILHTAYTIGSPNLSAPQATLMKSVAEGVFSGDLPWLMVGLGCIIGLIIISIDLRQKKNRSNFRVPILAVAVGIYLPIELTIPIFIGGMISHLSKTSNANETSKRRGLLIASGLITGEALIGIGVALPIFITSNKNWWPKITGFEFLGPVIFIGVIFWLYKEVTK
ncbi:oligopeptide transporter, OPT family [Candidatus Marinimicrobia bacterium]|nr:oligopeptide transporter, OPT family [Candidatus Neomarinimicrobiota bacterium]